MKKITIAALILVQGHLAAQKSLNLNFENEVAGSEMPKKWYVEGQGFKFSLDEKEKFSGKRSLKIQSHDSTNKQVAVCLNSFPLEYVKDKSIEFKGKIKTAAIYNGYAGLWWRVDGKDNSSHGFDDMADRGLRGDNDWTEVSIHMEIKGDVEKIFFGGLITGTGTVWFDNFEVFIEGKRFEDVEPKIIKPTRERISWLKKQIIPLKTFDPTVEGYQDLEQLGELIGDAQVVALGETTHGSSEIFQMKHRIVKYLTQKKDFSIFSIEANLPESYKINEYIFDGKGDPIQLIRGMYFWTWQTQEVLEMVEWMKEQNKTGKKIKFTGFDMQFFNASVSELNSAFENEPGLLDEINALKHALNTLKENLKKTGRIITQDYDTARVNQVLLNLKSAIQSSAYSKEKKDWLTRHTRILEQFLDKSHLSRDKYMAENFEWILGQNPGSKIVIWAHNGHIQKTGYSMGKFLAESLKEDYITVGFTFHKGKYTAIGKNGLNTYRAQDSYEGTFEYMFQSLNEPIFLLDLRKVKNDNSEHGQWMKEALRFRQVGSLKVPSEFQETNLLEDFDLLVFINESTNSELFKVE